MTDLEKIEKLRQEFVSTKNPDIESFRGRMKEEIESRDQEGKERLLEALNISVEKAFDRADKVYQYVTLKTKLSDILNIVSMSYIAENYFHKSRSWFSQRLNNHTVHGEPMTFTKEELSIISKALDEIADKLKTTAHSIV